MWAFVIPISPCVGHDRHTCTEATIGEIAEQAEAQEQSRGTINYNAFASLYKSVHPEAASSEIQSAYQAANQEYQNAEQFAAQTETDAAATKKTPAGAAEYKKRSQPNSRGSNDSSGSLRDGLTSNISISTPDGNVNIKGVPFSQVVQEGEAEKSGSMYMRFWQKKKEPRRSGPGPPKMSAPPAAMFPLSSVYSKR